MALQGKELPEVAQKELDYITALFKNTFQTEKQLGKEDKEAVQFTVLIVGRLLLNRDIFRS